LLGPSLVHAQRSVVVLGITSMEGDDDLAHTLTGAIRHAASRVDGWRVSDTEVTLAQMALAHGCSDEPDMGCLTQIAGTLGTQAIIYGILRRSGTDARSPFQLSLTLYDAQTQHIERSISETIPPNRTDIDDLREPARRMIAQLSGPQTGSIRVLTNVPGAEVRVDGEVAGMTGADGSFVASAVPIGSHRVEVRAEGHQPWSGSVRVATATEMELHADLVATGGSGGDDGGGGGTGGDRSGGASISWPGLALIGAGALALGATIYSWVRIQAIQNDPEFVDYRQNWTVENVCTQASMGVPHGAGTMEQQRQRAATVDGLCGEAGALEVLQYVFLTVAVGAAGAGAALLILDGGRGGSSEREVASFELMPHLGPNSGSITARLRF
jgi:hypothetical protein